MKRSRLLSYGLIVFIIILMSLFLVSCKEDAEVDTNTTQTYSVSIYIGDYLYYQENLEANSQIEKPEITEYGGYTITGWYDNNNYLFFPYTVNKDVVIKASISKNINVEFYVDNVKTSSDTYSTKESIKAPDSPSKTGYKFKGWSLNGDIISFPYSVSKFSKDTEIVRFDAVFEKTNNVSFYVDDTLYSTRELLNGENVLPAADPTKENKKFLFWKGEDGEVFSESIINNEDLKYYAVFEDVYYTVKYYVGSSATLYKTITTEEYAVNLNYTGAQYFYGWYTNKSYTTKFDFSKPITENTSLYGKTLTSNFDILRSYGTTQYISLDTTNFQSLYEFNATYPTSLSISVRNNNVTTTYSFKCKNNKYVTVTYDMFNGLITGVYGSNDAKISISLTKYNYENIDYTSYTSTDVVADAYYNRALKQLGLKIASEVGNKIHNEYLNFKQGFDSTITYEVFSIPEFTATVEKSGKNINISSSETFKSCLITYDGNDIYYEENNKNITFSNIRKGTYTIELTYKYTYNNNNFFVTKSYTINN